MAATGHSVVVVNGGQTTTAKPAYSVSSIEAEKKLHSAIAAVEATAVTGSCFGGGKNIKQVQEAVKQLESYSTDMLQILKMQQDQIAKLEKENADAKAAEPGITAQPDQVHLRSVPGSGRLTPPPRLSQPNSARVSAAGERTSGLVERVDLIISSSPHSPKQPSTSPKQPTTASRQRALEKKIEELKQTELLQDKLEALLKEHEKLRAENEKLVHTKSELTKKVKELTAKVKEHEEKASREARDVAIELKKAQNEKETAVAAAKAESVEQLTARAREVKTLTKHIDNLKVELEQTKDREKSAAQAKLDEAIVSAAKAHQELKAEKKKAADARADKEAVFEQWKHVHEELNMVAGEYGHVTRALTKAAGKLAVPACAYVKQEGPWPRQGFSCKGSCVLHNGTCTAKIDAARTQPHSYKSAAELEGWLTDGKFVLCAACKVAGF